jgi:hypothetical protein
MLNIVINKYLIKIYIITIGEIFDFSDLFRAGSKPIQETNPTAQDFWNNAHP